MKRLHSSQCLLSYLYYQATFVLYLHHVTTNEWRKLSITGTPWEERKVSFSFSSVIWKDKECMHDKSEIGLKQALTEL